MPDEKISPHLANLTAAISATREAEASVQAEATLSSHIPNQDNAQLQIGAEHEYAHGATGGPIVKGTLQEMITEARKCPRAAEYAVAQVVELIETDDVGIDLAELGALLSQSTDTSDDSVTKKSNRRVDEIVERLQASSTAEVASIVAVVEETPLASLQQQKLPVAEAVRTNKRPDVPANVQIIHEQQFDQMRRQAREVEQPQAEVPNEVVKLVKASVVAPIAPEQPAALHKLEVEQIHQARHSEALVESVEPGLIADEIVLQRDEKTVVPVIEQELEITEELFDEHEVEVLTALEQDAEMFEAETDDEAEIGFDELALNTFEALLAIDSGEAGADEIILEGDSATILLAAAGSESGAVDDELVPFDVGHDFEAFVMADTEAEMPANFEVVVEAAPAQPLEATFADLARYFSEKQEVIDGQIEADEAAPEQVIKRLLTEIENEIKAVPIDQTLEQSEQQWLTPEITHKLLELLKAVGYEQPQEVLIDFVSRYDLDYLLQAIRYLSQLLDDENRPEFAPVAQSILGDDDTNQSVSVRLGKMLLALLRMNRLATTN